MDASRAAARSGAEPDVAGAAGPGPAERLAAVRARMDAACAAAGRHAGSVRLLAVSKTRSADEVQGLHALGLRDFGENYVQEALDKIDALGDLGLGWHFIGPIQSNKTRPIAERFDCVHGVDRERIARRLAEHRPRARGPLRVFVQVNIDREPSKAGVAPEDAAALAARVAALPGLDLQGLMVIPRADADPEATRDAFRRTRYLLDALETPHAGSLSMGMSADLEAAIAEGATWVRIGTALFGPRPPAPPPGVPER